MLANSSRHEFLPGTDCNSIILDNLRHNPPHKRNHGTGSPTVEPILSLVWDGLRTEVIVLKSFGESTVPNILIFNIKFTFKFYFMGNKS